jgi:hypothetical protein
MTVLHASLLPLEWRMDRGLCANEALARDRLPALRVAVRQKSLLRLH